MDPLTTLQQLIEALTDSDADRAREATNALIAWRETGGFMPDVMVIPKAKEFPYDRLPLANPALRNQIGAMADLSLAEKLEAMRNVTDFAPVWKGNFSRNTNVILGFFKAKYRLGFMQGRHEAESFWFVWNAAKSPESQTTPGNVIDRPPNPRDAVCLLLGKQLAEELSAEAQLVVKQVCAPTE